MRLQLPIELAHSFSDQSQHLSEALLCRHTDRTASPGSLQAGSKPTLAISTLGARQSEMDRIFFA